MQLAELQGALLEEAQLQGASLEGRSCRARRYSTAQLQGASLRVGEAAGRVARGRRAPCDGSARSFSVALGLVECDRRRSF